MGAKQFCDSILSAKQISSFYHFLNWEVCIVLSVHGFPLDFNSILDLTCSDQLFFHKSRRIPFFFIIMFCLSRLHEKENCGSLWSLYIPNKDCVKWLRSNYQGVVLWKFKHYIFNSFYTFKFSTAEGLLTVLREGVI